MIPQRHHSIEADVQVNELIGRTTSSGDLLTAKDRSCLEEIQRLAGDYFFAETSHASGLVRDSNAPGSPSSIAAVGFGLTSLLVAIERGRINRPEASARVVRILEFLARGEQSEASNATGLHGFYYHFLEPDSGRRAWKSELSTIDSAILMLGILSVGLYFDRSEENEEVIRSLSEELYRRVHWTKMLAPDGVLLHGWRPGRGYLRWGWRGYNEALLLYILALGSPTHPIPETCYDEWLRPYRWVRTYGIDYLYAGPLFIHQYPQCWLDLRGIQDRFMRERGIDYFENSRRATEVQSLYCERNPRKFEAYGKYCWGITAGEGPGRVSVPPGQLEQAGARYFAYAARGVPYGPDDGTLAPWAAIASAPFAPELVLRTIQGFKDTIGKGFTPFGFEASINYSHPAYPDKRWHSRYHYGVNQGPIVLMIENCLTGFVWNLMRRSAHIRKGLERAGFGGGWLESSR